MNAGVYRNLIIFLHFLCCHDVVKMTVCQKNRFHSKVLFGEQFENPCSVFRRIDYDKIINDIVALPDYYVNTFWHEVVSRLRQRNKVGVKSLLRKSRPLVAALARDMATGAIINMLLGG